MKHKIISMMTFVFLLVMSFGTIQEGYSASTTLSEDYTILREVEKGTFNEFRYKITRDYLKLREHYSVYGEINKDAANRILINAKQGYKYLPNNLLNEDKYNALTIAVNVALKNPNSDVYYRALKNKISIFVDQVSIKYVTGNIDADPVVGNPPFLSTFRAVVQDPSGTEIGTRAYTWWLDTGTQKKIIGTQASISYTFKKEGTYTVFLDVKSSHKNDAGYVDVLPYTGKIVVRVKEKIGSVILRVGGKKVPFNNEIKFTPEHANYGLVFDATSSVPASGTKFKNTQWNFGNGITRSHSGSPKIERVRYSREGEYNVILTLTTNQGRVITQEFKVIIHKPIAVISLSKENGFIGDKITLKAVNQSNYKQLEYSWEVIDLEEDKVVFHKIGSIATYTFEKKGRYSVKLKIENLAGEFDIDTRDIYINSRAPIASFKTKILSPNKPNEIFFDATGTYDQDIGDDGHLKYYWTIDGQAVFLSKPNENGSSGYYTFDTIGEHSIILEVEDPDGLTNIKKHTVTVKSVLSVDFSMFPRVIQRDGSVKFVAHSENSKFYEWDFGDGSNSEIGNNGVINHQYTKSGIFKVKLIAQGKTNNSNSFTQLVYVGNSTHPVAAINISKNNKFNFQKEKNGCEGNEAYRVSRKDTLQLSSASSINVDGKNTGLEVSWKIAKDIYRQGPTLSYSFDDIGCYPVKLTVKSIDKKTTNSNTIWIKVENDIPTLSSLDISVVDITTDPVIVKVTAIGPKDRDGVIQSYLWYYTTDADSEPQDFKISKLPSTTFVLSKIPGNYYFGVILKDNNDAKISSETLVGKSSLTLAGDNINTPLIEFSVNDSSTSIGETLSFTVDATNVLGQSIEKTSKYSWDFDGDGFYERQTDKGTINYSYKKSGTFYPKVKVKNKGYSNTRTITINVANKLVSDFSYISIGNKYIFLDKSKGIIEAHSWDLGDGNIKKDSHSFVHEYTDKKSSHSVDLIVSEGTQTDKSTQKIQTNIKNILNSRKEGLNVFSYPSVNDKGSIILDSEESIFMYLAESKGSFVHYGVDYDIDKDSDINGGKDDDIDNINTQSYSSGDPLNIPLNNKRFQTIRMFLLDTNDKVVDSKDITIEKKYIQEKEMVDPNTLTFEGVSDGIKVKIEKIKTLITNLKKEHRVKGMLYIQKLQENWNDNTEKTKTIIDFEEFLGNIDDNNTENIILLLESLLVEGEEDKSEKNIAFIAIKALIPSTIICETTEESCYDQIVSKLETIKQSSDIELNRSIGKEILEVIVQDAVMTDKDKTDFKAVLKVLVYSGVGNIPADEVKEIVGDTSETIDSSEGQLWSFLKKVGGYFLWLIGVIIILMIGSWGYSFYKNRDSDEYEEDEEDGIFELEEMSNSNSDVEDPIGDDSMLENVLPHKDVSEDIKTMPKEDKKNNDFPSTTAVKTDTNTKLINKTIGKGDEELEEIPNWLKGDIVEDTTVKKSKKIKAKRNTDGTEKKENESIVQKDKDHLYLDTGAKIEGNTPDGLSESTNVNSKEELKTETKVDEPVVKVENESNNSPLETVVSKSDVKGKTKTVDVAEKKDDIPDWLQGSISDKKGKKGTKADAGIESTDEKTIEYIPESNNLKEQDIPEWLQESAKETAKVPVKKEKSAGTDEEVLKVHTDKTSSKIKETAKDKIDKKTDEQSKESKKKDVLWDDGMSVPDWLKTDPKD